MPRSFAAAILIPVVLGAFPAVSPAQATRARDSYPVPPRPLGEAEEIALALTAAPAEVSAHADVYALRGTDFVKVRTGTNGCACMVARDLHEGSRYPICYDQEGAKTSIFREILEGSLRSKGKSEAEVKRAVEAAYASGELRRPSKASVAYMMSPGQVLFSNPDSAGVRVGPWAPHLMLMLPGVSPDQLGLAADSKIGFVQIHQAGSAHSELIVKVPTWADGRPATDERRP